jgi:hypothetical protein
MRATYVFAAVACLAAVAIPRFASAQDVQGVLRARAQSSDLVVVGTIIDLNPVFETNEFGDQLIVSKVKLRVDEAMKGNANRFLDVSVEGGTIGDLTLDVSDMPSVTRGERATLFLNRAQDGSYVPHDRGFGIMKLDANDRAEAEGLTLAEIRMAVRGR